MVHGVITAHKKWEKLPLKEVVKPAIKMAREGIDVYPELLSAISYMRKYLEKFPGSKKIFLNREYKVGDKLIQEDLAKTLEIIAQEGIKGFYEGKIAKKISEESKKRGGYLTLDDFLSHIKQLKEFL